MRIGIVGPARTAGKELERALSLLLADAAVRQILYLGTDEAAQRIVDRWSEQRLNTDQFIDRAALLAREGSPDAIFGLLEEERAARRLQVIRRLPDSLARTVEMVDRWIVLCVHDKAVLDEEDIANAHVIIYGKAAAFDIKRFGPRCFFSPGPVERGVVGRLELLSDGSLDVRALDLAGETVLHEVVRSTAGKLVVTP